MGSITDEDLGLWYLGILFLGWIWDFSEETNYLWNAAVLLTIDDDLTLLFDWDLLDPIMIPFSSVYDLFILLSS
jgi:hypothetical protein